MNQTMEEILMAWDTSIFPLQSLEFVNTIKESIIQPVQGIELLGLQINFQGITLTFPQGKALGIVQYSPEQISDPLAVLIAFLQLNWPVIDTENEIRMLLPICNISEFKFC